MARRTVSWNFFISRRGINPHTWMARRGVTNYRELISALSAQGVRPPPLDVYNEMVGNMDVEIEHSNEENVDKPEPVPVEQSAVETVAPLEKTPKKKPTKTKSTKKRAPSVWEKIAKDSNLGAPEPSSKTVKRKKKRPKSAD